MIFIKYTSSVRLNKNYYLFFNNIYYKTIQYENNHCFIHKIKIDNFDKIKYIEKRSVTIYENI